MFEYNVIRKCFHNSHLYDVGDVIITDTEIKPLPSSIVDVTPIAEVGVLFRFVKARREPAPDVAPVQPATSIVDKFLNLIKR